jgi:hypothetical protein
MREEDRNLLSVVMRECEPLGLQMACLAIERLRTKLLASSFSVDARADAIKEIQQRISDEMESALFLYVPQERARYYQQSNLFGPAVPDIFPDAVYDIEEAGKCLATARGTACVFHLMRVMEVLLRHLGKLLKIPYAPAGNPTSSKSRAR